MELKLNLQQGSYDHLINFLFSYRASEEDHNTQSYYHQLKLKSALIDLCQAYELLLKQILYNVQSNLIYSDIDKKILLNAHTITFKKAINRVRNFTTYEFSSEEEEFMIQFNNLRNSFVHFEVNIKVDELKSLCLKGLDYYFIIHDHFIPVMNLDFLKDKNLEKKIKIKLNETRKIHKNHVFYRGYAFCAEDLIEYIEEQKKINPEIIYLYGKEAINRIKFGQENQFFVEMGMESKISNIYEYNYCPGCKVPLGEYHLLSYECDLEVCPNCGEQLLSCNCSLNYERIK